MHTLAPPVDQNPLSVCPSPGSPCKRKQGGFSLIEVTLAIAIVAFAFIALIGLLPAGMAVFNQTMDSTNEMRISSDLTALLQATEYNKLPTNQEIVNNIFYFDVDGGLLDTEMKEVEQFKDERIYAARIFVDRQNVPASTLNTYYDRNAVALKTLVIVGRNNPTVVKLLKEIETLDDIHKLPRQKVRVLPLVITKTDGQS
jgi:uncharacterized protein (TIGR02598 family)